MHLLITADTVGGVWTYARELVSGLVRAGHRVTLVSFGSIPSPDQTRWMDGLAELDFRPTAFRLEWMQEAQGDCQASSEFLQSVIDEVKPDLLHFNQFCYGALPTKIPKLVVAHSDVVSWWMEVHGAQPPDSGWMRWYCGVVAQGLAGANAVVAPSQWMLETARRHFAMPQRTAVIHNGRSPLLLNPHLTKENVVLSVGRLWDAGKQVSLLLEAGLEVPIWIAGDEGSSSLRRPSVANVAFRGLLNEAEMRFLLARAGIYVATSCYEPFGLAPVEAALSRCAIVANDIPTFRELWGNNVLYFRKNDAADLKTQIMRLFHDERLRQEFANRAYHHARLALTADRMLQQYLQLYSELIANRSSAAVGEASVA